MPNLKTAERILEFLKQQEKAVTPTTIHKENKISYNSVLYSIDFLISHKLVNSVSNGHIQLISFNRNEERAISENGNITRY